MTTLETARRVCTSAELQVIELAEQGMSQYQIAALLDISREAVRDRARRAKHKVEKAERGVV